MFRQLRSVAFAACLLTAALVAVGFATKTFAQSLPPTDKPALVILARTAIVALNHANQTGNYSVLRDLGTPSFARANTPAKLAAVFTKLRNRNLDLGPVVLYEPQFTRQPRVDRNGRLYLKGLFPTRPLQIDFELQFDAIAGHWRLHAIAVRALQADRMRSTTVPQQDPTAASVGGKRDLAPIPKSKPNQAAQ